MKSSREIANNICAQFIVAERIKNDPMKDLPDASIATKAIDLDAYDETLKAILHDQHITVNDSRRDKYCNSLHIQRVLSMTCCSHDCIRNHFTFSQVEKHLQLWTSLPQKNLSKELGRLLSACKVPNKATDRVVHIGGNLFQLQWHGVPLCRTAFQLLYGVSRNKLINVSQKRYLQPHGNSIMLHENVLTEDIISFLDELKDKIGCVCDDSKRVYLSGFYDKQHVWKYYVDNTPDIVDVASRQHFLAVWRDNRPSYVVESDALKCSTCTQLDIIIKANKSNNEVQVAQQKLKEHVMHARKHLSHLQSMINRSKADTTLLLFIGDHMKSKSIPKLKRNNMNILMYQLLNVHFSGWFDAHTGKSKYYIFPELWSESANSIVTCLHHLLLDLKPTQQKLTLVFDNHSTQHNNLLLAYCDWLVRFKHRFDEIEILFLIAGHTKNQQDQMNSHVAVNYMKRQFFCLDDILTLTDSRREFAIEKHIVDWASKFEPLINRYDNISKGHLFNFTCQGMKVKKFIDDVAWNVWNRHPETYFHQMLASEPKGLLEPVLPYELSITKKDDLRKSLAYIPPDKRHYLQELIEGKIGFALLAQDFLSDFGPVGNQSTMKSLGEERQVQFQKKRKRVDKRSKIGKDEIVDLLATQNVDELDSDIDSSIEEELNKHHKKTKRDSG